MVILTLDIDGKKTKLWDNKLDFNSTYKDILNLFKSAMKSQGYNVSLDCENNCYERIKDDN